ncbi:leucine-rich repeat protein [Lacrimispora sp.]|jgi:hypothetical protein|uniref:leucine-rich repeat protein n=1 Tax=Lacrimispora sp. TaxID=2719234 RepID=UPI0029E5598F|nr:hypothetical protein [Lacrimispora sp.]
MFLYQIINNQVRILECRGYDGTVRIPEKIGELPVTELAEYVFSNGEGRREMLSKAGNDVQMCDEEGNPASYNEKDLPPEIICERLQDLYLPVSIKKIGKYAFYNCFELNHLECFSSIFDLGSGLFTGCSKIKSLDIHIVDGSRSCMQGIVSELRQELYVNYYVRDKAARLIFPEMYEESVEHTPARIVFREMHGCGHMYRYCFDQTEFQFHKYDALFPHVRVQESDRLACSLAMGRLYTPINLLPGDRKIYESYLREHLEAAGEAALKDSELFYWLASEYCRDQAEFDRLIDMASEKNYTELLSPLMDLRHLRFPVKKRTFSL